MKGTLWSTLAQRLCLGAVLVGVVAFRLSAAAPEAAFPAQSIGVEGNLPVFTPKLKERLTFPLSWTSGRFGDFAAWRKEARGVYYTSLLAAPPHSNFSAELVREEDRGAYWAREISLQLTADSRVLALLTVPKGQGPFPAVVLLHDHGARFDLGKEKLIKPMAGSPRLAASEEWVAKGLGGRFLGDELARRGYVCLAIDALNWGDRGGGGYEGQQAIASNLLNLGSSFAGLIAWEDLRSAEFLVQLPFVDRTRVAAMGWSMGAHRAWQMAALSEHIAAAVAVCWMATLDGLVVPGGNLTRGASAYTMTHPGLAMHLDYPDRAAIACPKPMLFFNGRRDSLFPVPSVEEAYAKMHDIWRSQNADERLVTRLWDVGHVFDQPMQEEAFAWLDRELNRRPAADR